MLRTKPNEVVFEMYKTERGLRIRNRKNLERYCQTLDEFQAYIGQSQPDKDLAMQFLSRWSNSKPATLHKYAGMIKGFMHWYGEDLDLKIRLPHQLPEYVEGADVHKMLAAVADKKTHKKGIARDTLLIELAYKSGLRRGELANLKVRDIVFGERELVVRSGKGLKDRTVPLPSDIVSRLGDFTGDMQAGDSVFGLLAVSISDKITRIARKAGVKMHAHSFRHGYATRLLEKGANPRAVQQLLGHVSLATTENYLGLLPRHLREAVDLLDPSAKAAPVDRPQQAPVAEPPALQREPVAKKRTHPRPRHCHQMPRRVWRLIMTGGNLESPTRC